MNTVLLLLTHIFGTVLLASRTIIFQEVLGKPDLRQVITENKILLFLCIITSYLCHPTMFIFLSFFHC